MRKSAQLILYLLWFFSLGWRIMYCNQDPVCNESTGRGTLLFSWFWHVKKMFGDAISNKTTICFLFLRTASCFSEGHLWLFFCYEGISITLPLKYITDTLNTDTSILETFKLYKSYISKQYTKIQTRIKKG